ncbi:hypothetical protein ACFL35_05195, partial [Candidatus Riflebacteria bacterium]
VFKFNGSFSILNFELREKVPVLNALLAWELNDGKKFKELLGMFVESALKRGKIRVSKKMVIGTEINLVTSLNLKQKLLNTARLGYCIFNNMFLLGSEESLERVLQNLQKPKEKSLGTNEVFIQCKKKINANPIIFGFLNLAGILDRVKTMIPDKKVIDVLDMLGLLELKFISTAFLSAGEDFSVKTTFSANRLDKGLLKVLSGEDVVDVPAVIPDDIADFSQYHFHFEVLFQTLDKVVAQHFPEKYPFFAMGMSMVPGMIGATVEELLKSIGPGYTVFSRYEKPYNLKSERKCLLMQIRNHTKLQEILNTLLDTGKLGKVDKVEYLENTIFKLNVPQPDSGNEKMQKLLGKDLTSPGFCLLKEFLIFSNDLEMIKNILRRKAKVTSSFKNKEEFKKLISMLPEKLNQVSFTNMEKLGEFFTTLLKNKEILNLIKNPKVKKLVESGYIDKLVPMISKIPWMGKGLSVDATDINILTFLKFSNFK